MGETPAVRTFQPSTRIGGAIEKSWIYKLNLDYPPVEWMDEVSPQNSSGFTEVFPKWKLEPGLLEAISTQLETLTLGHPGNHFLQNHPTKKLQKVYKN